MLTNQSNRFVWSPPTSSSHLAHPLLYCPVISTYRVHRSRTPRRSRGLCWSELHSRIAFYLETFGTCWAQLFTCLDRGCRGVRVLRKPSLYQSPLGRELPRGTRRALRCCTYVEHVSCQLSCALFSRSRQDHIGGCDASTKLCLPGQRASESSLRLSFTVPKCICAGALALPGWLPVEMVCVQSAGDPLTVLRRLTQKYWRGVS